MGGSEQSFEVKRDMLKCYLMVNCCVRYAKLGVGKEKTNDDYHEILFSNKNNVMTSFVMSIV